MIKKSLYYLFLLLSLIGLTSCGSPQEKPARIEVERSDSVNETAKQSLAPNLNAQERLGTQWGEGIESKVSTVDLKRLSSQPVDVSMIYYSAGNAKGTPIKEMMIANGKIGVSILNERDQKWTLMNGANNRVLLKGQDKAQYKIRYHNLSNRIYEVVTTVDGLDVINGSAGSLSNSGYVLYPNQELIIEGFRKSQDEVAAFRFSSVQDAYAANTPAGSASNTGVIGTAIFELYDPSKVRTEPSAFPADQSNGQYAPPPQYR
ncbi:hypothetical protein [Neisseria sp. Ec49-e6-T10]|uniref:hypothetical protein n=1 Tax=Neisseria sp. Ec49-e6-T10 TaxID=3140744 RepID=UPI003EB83184